MTEGPQLHVVTKGEAAGPAVVFLHGFLGAGDDWDEVVGEVARDFHCIAIDLPGHGGSVGLGDDCAYTFDGAAEGVIAALEVRKISSAILVGYSMGGRLALQLAVNHPGRWRGLVLESASPGLATEVERAERVVADEGWVRQLEARPFEGFLTEWYAQPVFRERLAAGSPSKSVLARRQKNDPTELVRALRGMGLGRQPSLWKELEALKIPMLLVAGADDPKFVEISVRMACLFPNASRVIVPGAGHHVHGDEPAAFLRELRAFLKTLK